MDKVSRLFRGVFREVWGWWIRLADSLEVCLGSLGLVDKVSRLFRGVFREVWGWWIRLADALEVCLGKSGAGG